MQLTELFGLIQLTLGRNGLRLLPAIKNSMTLSRFILHDSDLRVEKVLDGFGAEAFYGCWLEVRECSRRNGAKFNTSYYLAIAECERSSAHDVKRIKLKCDQTPATLSRKIAAFAAEYKRYADARLLEAKISEYLQSR